MSHEKSCFHCGLPVPDHIQLTVIYENQAQATCCAGCQAVAQSIIDAGLGNYYKNRTSQAQKAELPPDEILAQLKLYDLPEMQAEFVETLPENAKEAMLMLSGITCAACTWLIEQRLLRLAGVIKVELNYSTQRVRVRWDTARLNLSDILYLIQQIGYSAAPYDPQKMEVQAQQNRKKMLIRMAVAGLSSAQTMMFAMPTYLYNDVEAQYLTILNWGGLIMSLPAMLYAAQPFYLGAWRDVKNQRLGMDTPVALALTLGFTMSVYGLLGGLSVDMHFASLSMFVFFLLIGRFMELSMRHKVGDAAERLVKLVPAFCHKLPHYPNENSEETPVIALQKDDVIVVRAGEVIPIDGTVLQGESEVNEAMLTGESLPIAKRSGSLVTAGTLNLHSPLIVRVSQVGQQTRLAHIVKLLDTALSQKPRLAELAERYASWFTFAVLVLGVLTFGIWFYLADVATALWVTVSLLVVTCPCALALATPAALAASTGKLASSGILVARGHALETLAHISDAVLDKTGTLTQGKLSVQAWHNVSGSLNNDELIAIAKLLEQQSEHPIAQAILNLPHNATAPLFIAQKLNKIGHGVSAQITFHNQTQIWAIGKPEFVADISGSLSPQWAEWAKQGSLIALGNQQGFQAAFILQDTVKHDAENMLQKLAQQNINLHILSGDNEAAVSQLAQTLNIAHHRANATPEDKLHYVQTLQQQNKRVLMLGDGINDAPVLAAADVSVAVAGSADVARDGADVVLLHDDLAALPTMLLQAKRTQKIIQQNLWWATGYNLLVVPMAMLGWVTPLFAAIGMSASSLIVVWNALRLRK